MRRFRRTRTLAFVVGVALAVAAGAIAAFVVFTGVNGTSTGTFQSSSSSVAITISGNESTALGPGSTVPLSLTLTNNDPNAAHTLVSPTWVVTTKDSSGIDDTSTCASSFAMALGNISNVSVPAGGTVNKSVTVTLQSSTPSSCAGGTYSIAWAGTTNP